MPIEVLKKEIAELIAAGEVVERPASVVKELVENAMDAKATKVEIELRRSGLESIRVTDNGSGIRRDEIKTAFLRHATSKISKADDLDNISTLGFRGEALVAIAAVSRVRMVTKTSGEAFAFEYCIEGGDEMSFGEAAGGDGTTIVVADLFYNTPARMKFLKKDVSEGTAVQNIVEQLALSHPDVAFRMIREGKTVISTPGNGELQAAIYALFPKEISGNLIEVTAQQRPISATGYVGKPEASRKSRGFQYVFINGRYVKSGTVSAAVEQAYRNLNMVGRFPVFVLNIAMPYEDVDVNVHPTKTEVRFKNDREVFSAVHHSVADALNAYTGNFSLQTKRDEDGEIRSLSSDAKIESVIPSDGFEKEDQTPQKEKETVQTSFLTYRPEEEKTIPSYSARQVSETFEIKREDRTAVSGYQPVVHTKRVELDIDPGTKQETRKALRVVGEIFATYILAEYDDSFILIDKHAAHERILFEKYRAEELHGARQVLLQPEIIAVTPPEKDALLSSGEQLMKIGFLVEEFGANEVAVREVPTYFPGKDVKNAVLELAEQLLRFSNELETEETSWLLHSVSCRAAIKAGHRTTEQEMVSLAREILYGAIPKYCPHGRPVYFSMTKKEIEKQFGRIQ